MSELPRWTEIDRWLKLQHGMREETVLELLGTPTTAAQSGRDRRRYRYGVVREGGNEGHACGWIEFEGHLGEDFKVDNWSAPDLAELEEPR